MILNSIKTTFFVDDFIDGSVEDDDVHVHVHVNTMYLFHNFFKAPIKFKIFDIK